LRQLGRRSISVMFITFIAVCILPPPPMYTLHPTRLHADVSEAGRVYAEAARDRV